MTWSTLEYVGSLTGDGCHESAQPPGEKCQSGLEAHGVVCKSSLLELHVDGVAVEGRGEGHAVFEMGRVLPRGIRRQMIRLRSIELGCRVRTRSRGQRLAEVDVTRFEIRRICIGKIRREQFHTLRAHLECVRMDAEVGIEVDWHGVDPSKN